MFLPPVAPLSHGGLRALYPAGKWVKIRWRGTFIS